MQLINCINKSINIKYVLKHGMPFVILYIWWVTYLFHSTLTLFLFQSNSIIKIQVFTFLFCTSFIVLFIIVQIKVILISEVS